MTNRDIFLVRHGEDIGSELTELGRSQAHEASVTLMRLANNPQLVTIMSSDRLRAGQTAEIIARNFDTEVVISKELGDAGVAPEIVMDFVSFLDRCLTQAGVDYDSHNPLIVVTHAPMVAAATGVRSSAIANGQVEKWNGKTWQITQDY